MSEINLFYLKNAKLLSSTNPVLQPFLLNNEKQRDPDTRSAFVAGLEVEESMFSPTITGRAIVRDYGMNGPYDDVVLKNLGLGGYDILELTFETDDVSGGLPIPSGSKKAYTFQFLIYAYSQETSETYSLYSGSPVPRIVILKLASPEFAVMNYLYFDYFNQDEDMIMPISRIGEGIPPEIIINQPTNPNQSSGQESGPITIDDDVVGGGGGGEGGIASEGEDEGAEFEPGPVPNTQGMGLDYSGMGMVQYLVGEVNKELKRKKLPGVPLLSENTLNWVWLKKDYNFYPWGKMASPPRFNQLVQMLTENAVHEQWNSNVRAANFFFWRTMDSWNFFSLESLVKKQPTREYNLTPDMNQAESIHNLSTSNVSEGLLKSSDETDNLALLNSYAFGSNYLLVEPKYVDDPYGRYLDNQKAHVIGEIKYNYLKDGIYWSRLPQPDGVKDFISKGLNFDPFNSAYALEFSSKIVQNRIIDKNYGYFSPGYFNRQNNVPWEYYGYEHSSRQEETLWQTQFDITDLDAERLRWFQKEVKKYVREKRKEYADKKNLKEKWKVYKCSICCAGSDIGVTDYTGPGFTGFTDERFLKSFDLRDNLLSSYEVVAAGAFSDVLNYNSSLKGIFQPFGDGSVTDSGLTLSYNLNTKPYNMSLGEFFSLEKDPDNFVKYRFDLEIKRHQKLKEILLKNKEAREIRKQKYEDAVDAYDTAYQDRNETCNDAGCTGNCLCPTEYPETVIIKSDLVKGAHETLIGHEEKILDQIDPIIEKLEKLKEEFELLYDRYWSRKAFFFSRNINFPKFLKTENNLLNVKSITRKPIRGSKYEPFAVRKAAGNIKMIPGKTGSVDVGSYPIGSPGSIPDSSSPNAGTTCMYPYDVPPEVDDLGSKNAVSSAGSQNICGLTAEAYFGRGYESSGNTGADFWSSFSNPYANFPYTEAGEERPKGPIWYKNWIVSYQISLIKPPCLNRKPPCFNGDCSCDEIVLDLNMHFETFANYKDADILTQDDQVVEYAFNQLSKNCDGCKIRILSALPASEIKLYHPWAADELPGLSAFGPEDYNDYKRSASLFKAKPGITLPEYKTTDPDDEPRFPPHLILEGLESYVRVEFMSPIGAETLKDFPEGFIDTHGSEYFLPYIVLATAGPFGAQAARANISVIGQDPFGFDLAVKKIKNRDDFAAMNLVFAIDERGGIEDPYSQEFYVDPRTPFSTSSSWLKTSQNSLFYKPKDGVADLFVPNGVQDIFRASALERSVPVKTWWDMWVSLPPVAVATFYNRHDVTATGPAEGASLGGPGVAFYANGSLVAEPYAWTGGCSGGGCAQDPPWPLFLHPDTEQIITGAFASNAAVIPTSEIFQSAEFVTGPAGTTTFIPGKTASILSNDPSNYIYRIADFPHIIGDLTTGLSGPTRKQYDSISYPVGTLIWGKDLPPVKSVQGENGQILFYDYNYVNYYDISRKTQYGLVQLSSDSMPSLLTLINGVGGEIQKIQEYQKWVSDKLIDWFQNTIFDNNFSAQFVVLSRQDGCKGYPCMNPEGFPGIDGCSPDDPLCNCPCQGSGGNKGKKLSDYVLPGAQMPTPMVLRPDLMDMVDDRLVGVTYAPTGGYWGPEPSSLELKILEKQISECNIVAAHPRFGETWLGCVWDDPESDYNCSCPCIGKNFPTYMKYNRTQSTFWSTPLEAPLYRTAQMALFNSNKITIDVPGDFYVVTGDVVTVNASRLGVGHKRFAGNWIVSSIKHFFADNVHTMRMVLSRELPHPNPEGG